MTVRLVRQAASLLLAYPDADWPATLDLVASSLAGARGQAAAALARFCADVADVPPLELGARYVATFDRDRRRTLHLTYYTDGDTRARGARLAEMKALYRLHGWNHEDGELPDFLPVMLEFAARVPDPGTELLTAHRAGLELLRLALRDAGSAYEAVIGAVCSTLPGASPRDREAARALARSGPPTETVGVEGHRR
ncbi:nitrate reductase molybdenum cofactor assembly chaperone [Actinomadura terrae]|uniref:nitrate reductase molybdenum cofactor assembly chaperone n=1 Tax=Actinomadura terrae TaxID=604353 RepID=UPI001FA70A2A|nr:nitrate reductase molybdenum cofactor assembly chaperone [Actinomadura terrae]